MEAKLKQASELFQKHFGGDGSNPTTVAIAPGRVNLIGEHTDYTGGYVLPFAIDYSTAAYGFGELKVGEGNGEKKNKKTVSVKVCSSHFPDAVEHLEITPDSSAPEKVSWTTYVAGTILQYLPDLPESARLNLTMVITGDVPLGSGLSSSASLEVAVAKFVEEIIGPDHAFSSEQKGYIAEKVRALRCQKAENIWCQSPCGIMDQYVSSAASAGSLLLIDCTSLEFRLVPMAQTAETPVVVVTNSKVQHSIGVGEYPIRVKQCKEATEAFQKNNINIKSLREATLENILEAEKFMDNVIFRRAKHVVTENARTLAAKAALEDGEWKQLGALMNLSHASMKDDFEVSCEEIDILVKLAQEYPGVYGSRLTGGGFGGCTVTLVIKEQASSLIEHLKKEYKEKTGKECDCFVTTPSQGAHSLPITS